MWLMPYVKSVRNLVPVDQIASIRGYRVATGKIEDNDGLTRIYRKRYYITIRQWNLDETKTEHKKGRYEGILHTLAHELAHTVMMDHAPAHFHLMSRIMLRFAKVLEREGITDTSKRFHIRVMKKHIEQQQVEETKLA